MRSRIIIVVIVCLTFVLVGCSDFKATKDTTDITIKQREYLEGKGYNIISSDGSLNSYVLDKDMLSKLPYSNIWGLQSVDAKSYIGKKIDTYSYVVNNHKLDGYGDKNETLVWLIVYEDEIIGGYSFPNNSEDLNGCVYSIDGETLEEVTGKDFQTWRKEWEEKYY